eukprot:TRINITY_DN520_c1_g1_i1.p2 TRINITY_DN520_c1_g1~~TRINITY_DN520_c1_g1_i1.p2  ORF type:complete len:182 (-),score=2.21 TRINITY_DN520_c1_g1_i1:692-1237(-)
MGCVITYIVCIHAFSFDVINSGVQKYTIQSYLYIPTPQNPKFMGPRILTGVQICEKESQDLQNSQAFDSYFRDTNFQFRFEGGETLTSEQKLFVRISEIKICTTLRKMQSFLCSYLRGIGFFCKFWLQQSWWCSQDYFVLDEELLYRSSNNKQQLCVKLIQKKFASQLLEYFLCKICMWFK